MGFRNPPRASVAASGHLPPTSQWPLLAVLLSLTVGSAGCKVGPDYCGAPSPIQDRWIDADTDPRVCGDPEDTSQWWNQFNDPVLTSLIATLDSQNLTLRGAAYRIQAARAARGIAAGNLFPQAQTANGGVLRTNGSQTTAVVSPVLDFDTWGLAMFDAGWELDFWGKFRRNIEAAEGDLQASIGTYDDILVSLQGETAAAYIQLRTLERRLELARGNVEIQEGSLKIAEARFRNGAVTELDVTQGRQILAQTAALIPEFEAGIRIAKNTLCVLIGTPPGSLDEMLDAPAEIPQAPETICAGVPAELLQRRPDIREAWHRAAAQSATIGIAITDLYPSFIIAGDIGYQSQSLSNLFNTRSVVGAVGPSFTWKILNYGRIKNNIRLQEELLQSELANYQQTVLAAYREVEDGLVGFSRAHDQVEALEVSADQAAKSVDIVVAQYQNGAVDFNRVFTLLLNLVNQQDLLAATEGQLATQVVAVYKGLGGGWQARMSGYTMPVAANEEPLPPPVPMQQDPNQLPEPADDTEENADEADDAAEEAIDDAADENAANANPAMQLISTSDTPSAPSTPAPERPTSVPEPPTSEAEVRESAVPDLVIPPELPDPLAVVKPHLLPRLPHFAKQESAPKQQLGLLSKP